MKLPTRYLWVLVIGGLVGCSDQAPPMSVDAAPLQAPRGVVQAPGVVPPGFTPNGVPYRNAAYRHATGRSGGASLTARALMNMGGTTDLEVTTGELNDDAPPYEIRKLQVKLLDDAGDAVWTENENHLSSGYLLRTYGGLARHDDLRVQAQVRVPNASGKHERTGVVTLTERVNLRPDPAVLDVVGPPEAVVGTEVVFSATLAELNGDLSATADCVYLVDDAEVTRSAGVWIGEGDVVSCVLSHVFEDLGEHTVTVLLDHVDPGDWDLRNNTASTTIDVVGVFPLAGWASAAERNETYQRHVWTSSYRSDTNGQKHYTEAAFYGASQRPLTFPARLEALQSSGGVEVDQTILEGMDGPGCYEEAAGVNLVSVCTDEAGGTSVNITRKTGWAQYITTTQRSVRVCHYLPWGSFCTTTWERDSYTENESWGDGSFAELGSDYTFDVTLEDADGLRFPSGAVRFGLTAYDQWVGPSWDRTHQWGREGQTNFGTEP